MYYVYKITLPQKEVYVGCTNNLRRRKDQHNGNVKKCKNRFADYVAHNYKDLIFSTKDLEIQAAFKDRNEALKFERQLTKSLIPYNLVLNDNYNVDCSRKGKNLGNTSKEYVLIDIENNSCEYVFNLRQYCINHSLDYKLIQRTVSKKSIAYNKYKVFYKQEWEDIENKDYYLSGEFYKDKLKEDKEIRVKKIQRRFKILTPSGEIIEIENLEKFSREHNLTSGTLSATYTKKNKTKGYQVIERM